MIHHPRSAHKRFWCDFLNARGLANARMKHTFRVEQIAHSTFADRSAIGLPRISLL
jgi:hypothetical protein